MRFEWIDTEKEAYDCKDREARKERKIAASRWKEICHVDEMEQISQVLD